jgi:hypothetical protein
MPDVFFDFQIPLADTETAEAPGAGGSHAMAHTRPWKALTFRLS